MICIFYIWRNFLEHGLEMVINESRHFWCAALNWICHWPSMIICFINFWCDVKFWYFQITYFYTSCCSFRKYLFVFVSAYSLVDLSASSSITIYSSCVKLDFSFFVSCFINALISFSIRSIDVLIVWCVFWRVLFSSFLIFKGTYSFGWLTGLIQVSSLKWSRSLINRKKFVNSKKKWFLLNLFEVSMKRKQMFW